MFLILKKIIGSTANIVENYGGFEITVTDDKKFPWIAVFSLLLDSGFQIWIDRKGSHIQVMSKPEVN
ncbi:hypothetical protein [Nitrosopumilus sp.]|uniref:hypothetical protein n=1 Tax=Nitrosopumilus sp. TaxID=2024843 RepID=UPI002930E016|nr:hypothetical protein [Nitrosopumilus sp.]